MSLVTSHRMAESADAHSAFLAMVKRMRRTSSKSRAETSLRAASQKLSRRTAPYSSSKKQPGHTYGRTGRAGLVRERASTPSTATDSSAPSTPERPARLPLPTPGVSYFARGSESSPYKSGFSCAPADIAEMLFESVGPLGFTTLGRMDAEYLGMTLPEEPELDSKQDALVAEMFAKYIDLDGGQGR